MSLALGGQPAAGQEASDEPSTAPDAAAASATIGFTNSYQDDGFFSDIETGAREAAAAAGAELLVETAWGSAGTQASQVTQFIEQGVDAIVIVPIDPDAIVPSVEAANAAGIPVLAVDRTANSGMVIEIQGLMAVSSGSLRSEGFHQALDATVAQQPRLMGLKAIEAAIAVLAGEPVEPFIPVETILLTAANVDQFMATQ